MEKLEELKREITTLTEKVTTLEEKVDAEQIQIQALLDNDNVTIAGLKEQNEALKAQIVVLEEAIAAGVTEEAVQGVIDSVKPITEKIDAITADIESTVADVTPPPPDPIVE